MKLILKSFVWFYFLIVILLPVLSIFSFLFSKNWWNIYFDTVFLKSFINSIFIGISTTLLALIIGTILGFFISRVEIPIKKTLIGILTLPILFVPYQFALGWSSIFSEGIFNHLLFSKIGVILILTGVFYPIGLWFSFIAFTSIPKEEEESGLLNYPEKKVFYQIVFKKSIPYIVVGGFFIFFFSFSELGVPTYLGVNVLPYQILVEFSAFYNIYNAFSMALPMAFIGFILFIGETIIFKKMVYHQKFSEQKPIVFKGKYLKIFALLFCILISVIFLFVPIYSLIINSFDLESIKIVLKNVIPNLINSIFYGLSVSFLAGVWALISIYTGKNIEKIIFSIGSLAVFFLPSVVLAVSIIFIWSKISIIYGTFLILILALLSRFSFISFKLLETAFGKLEPSSIETAVLTGAREIRILKKIIYPQIKKWFFLGILLVFVFCMNELGASSMLYPPGGEPLTVKLYTLSVNNPIGVSSVIALINSITTLIFVFIFLKLGKIE